jgi:DNA-binding LacI/PurR family transcriptional regulator
MRTRLQRVASHPSSCEVIILMSPKGNHRTTSKPVTLKTVAEHVGVTAGTVSAVLNNSPASRAIPLTTRERIQNAARTFNYPPNFFARSLRKKPTHLVAVISAHIGEIRTALITAGIESQLREKNYLFIAGAHQQDPHLLERYAHHLMQHGVEGFIVLDFQYEHVIAPPMVTVGSKVFSQRVAHDVVVENHTDHLPAGILDASDMALFHAPLLQVGRTAARLLLQKIAAAEGAGRMGHRGHSEPLSADGDRVGG